jgi:hypothetical protein
VKFIVRASLLAALSLSLSGCLAVAAGSAVVGATGAVIGTGVKATGALAGAVIPGGGDKKD